MPFVFVLTSAEAIFDFCCALARSQRLLVVMDNDMECYASVGACQARMWSGGRVEPLGREAGRGLRGRLVRDQFRMALN